MVKMLLHADLLMLEVAEHLIGLIVGILIIMGFLAYIPGIAVLLINSLLRKDFTFNLLAVGSFGEILPINLVIGGL